MKLLQKLGLAACVGILTGLISATTLFEDLEFRVSDLWCTLRGAQPRPEKVVVIAMDEPSYKELGVPYGPPWPRSLHAKLLRRLKDLGAKQVVFDIVFTGPGANPDANTEFEAALAGIHSTIGAELAKQTVSGQGGGYEIEFVDRPYEPFRKVATEALAGLPKNGGVIRSFPFMRVEQERDFPFLAEAAATYSHPEVVERPGPYDLIRYYGPGRALRPISYWEVVSDDSPLRKADFQDATVFVGLSLRTDTGGAQKDSFLSPYGPPDIFGLEVHATIYANLVNKSWIVRPSPLVDRLAQAVIAGAATFIALSVTPVVFAGITAFVALAWCGASFFAFGSGFFLPGAPTVLFVVPSVLLTTALYSYVSARRAEESLRSAFSLYISPEMVPKLQAEGGALKLGGEKLWITAIFTDIADFTSITEDMPAEKTSEMLNAYFTEVVEVVFKNKGTLVKFIGDAIFAIWGAPIKLPNHADLAIQAAREIQTAIDRFNSSQRFPRLTTRIGVHTGPMLVGNLGSAKRFDYTAIGDSVNLASRIEGLNKYFGTTMLLSEATRKDAGGFAGAVHIATVRVKGRKEPVRLHSVFDPPLDRAVLADWESVVAAFSSGRLQEAKAGFKAVSEREPRLAGASARYLEETEDLSKGALPQGWAGELDFLEK